MQTNIAFKNECEPLMWMWLIHTLFLIN